MKTLFAVPWIEVEYGWGDRFEGYKLFDNELICIEQTKKDSKNGNYESGEGYFGPSRPLIYYETPYDESLEEKKFVDNLKFKSEPKYIR